MDADTIVKSRLMNQLEGMALTTLFKALPTFTIARLCMKLLLPGVFHFPGGGVIFIAASSLIYVASVAHSASRHPLSRAREQLFFVPSFSFAEKIAHWLAEPAAMRQLVRQMLILELLAVLLLGIRFG
jgi:hypothetical protein